MFQGRISSDVKYLNILHQKYNWIPDESMIRPSPEIIRKKHALCEHIYDTWASFRDYILHIHFNYMIHVNEQSRTCISMEVEKAEWAFVPCSFPYRVPPDSQHFVLWNSSFDCDHVFEESEINEQIRNGIQNLGHNNFDFAWYVNPKPSIPELWHCQVFWRLTCDILDISERYIRKV